MADQTDFVDFVRRIRAGDQAAVAELVRRYEPLIRREVRLRIGDDRLNRAFDSIDVSQSVLANFFVRAATGEYVLESPDQLPRLLMTMARNKVISRARQERRLVRDVRRLAVEPGVLDAVADGRPSPSELASRKEQLALIRASLTDKEREIFELRTEGLGWDEIAERLGGTGQARRMQLARGLARLEQQLGLVE